MLTGPSGALSRLGRQRVGRGDTLEVWHELVHILGRSDFIYVADSKLCDRDTLQAIAAGGGRFLTVLPRSRAEDDWFREWIQLVFRM